MVLGTQTINNPRLDDFSIGSQLRRDIKRQGNVKHIIHHKDNKIVFILTEKKTLVRLNVQTFSLEAIEVPGDLWARRLKRIRNDILARKIDCIDTLVHECKGSVNMIPAKLDWYV